MVIPMWQRRWLYIDEFMSLFDSEQDYVDAAFMQIVLLNFGVWVNTDSTVSNRT